MALKRLRDAELECLRKDMLAHWDTHPYAQRAARFEAPLGEWCGGPLTGVLWAYKLTGKHIPLPTAIEKGDSFNAQGLEGKLVFDTDLASALVYWYQCEPHRAAVYA